MGFFQHIKYLNLRGCTQVTDKFLKYFTGFHGLSHYARALNNPQSQRTTCGGGLLSAQMANCGNGSLDQMRLLPAIPLFLKSLDLSKCAITDKSLEYLCRLVAVKPDVLKRLSVRACENVSDEGVRLLAVYCRALQHLNVTRCARVTASSLRDVKRNCRSCIIQHTNFSFC